VLGRCLPGCCVLALPSGFRRACLVGLASSRGDEHVVAWRPGVLYVLMGVGALVICSPVYGKDSSLVELLL
jgi:hypothetical protein